MNSEVSFFAGRLSSYTENWKLLGSNRFVISMIKGYSLEFKIPSIQDSIPKSRFLSPLETKDLQTMIQDLLNQGVICKCKSIDGEFVSQIFLVPKPDGRKRLIFNLKELNTFVLTKKFKMENIFNAMKLINKGDFLSTLDLKDAYYTVPMHKNFRKYLRFTFNGDIYEFTCLPFGLCTAPCVFTKLMKPVTRYLREKGIRLIIYLDDFLIIGSTYNECKRHFEFTKSLLESLGFIVNKKKSVLEPTNSLKFLGFMLNTADMTISLPLEKKSTIYNLCDSFLNKSSFSILELAKIIGTLVAATPAVPYGFAHIKFLERVKYRALARNRGNYNGKILLSSSMKIDLEWWRCQIMSSINFFPNDKYDLEIFTDASTTG